MKREGSTCGVQNERILQLVDETVGGHNERVVQVYRLKGSGREEE